MSSCHDSHHAATNITKKYPNTLPETDIAPENRPGPKKKTTLPTVHFQGRLLLVSGRVPAFVWESGLPLVKKDHICGLVVTQILNQLAIPTFIKQWQALFPQPSFRSSTGVGKLLTAAYLVDGENGRRFWMLKTLCSVLTVLWFFGRPSAAAISSTVSLIKLYVIMIHTWCIYVINIYIYHQLNAIIYIVTRSLKQKKRLAPSKLPRKKNTTKITKKKWDMAPFDQPKAMQTKKHDWTGW